MNNNFPNNWQQKTLEDCMEAIIDYRGKTPEKTSFGIPLITAKIVKDGRINNIEEYIATKDYDSWMRRGIPQAGDIVMTTEAPLGEIAQLDNRKVALAQRLITLRGDSKLLDNNYLRFLMQSSFIQNQLHERATGTTVLGIKQSELRKINLVIPPLSEQKAIAHILGTLDDKIELNRQMNETLEAMAREIFKSWFVDFDPVRAKIEGRQPAGMDAATADLFPNDFEESSLGLIPKGWKVETLGDVCEFAYGKTLKKESRRNGNIPVYGSNGQIGWHDEAIVNSPGVIVGRKGNPGIVKYSHTSFYPIDTTFYIIPKGKVMSMQYLFHYLSFLDLASLGADSAVPGLNRNMAYMSKILIPPTNILDYFERYTFSLADYIYSNTDQSRNLENIRDTLLPKLMSGQIRVKETEKLLTAVA